MIRTALADPNDRWPERFAVDSFDRLERLFGPLDGCSICGRISVNPTHPNCERPPLDRQEA